MVENYSFNVVLDDISDHLPSTLSLKGLNSAKTEPIKINSRDTRERNVQALTRELTGTDWTEIFDMDDVNLSTKRFHECLVAEVYHHLPVCTRQIKYKSLQREPWVSAGIMCCIRRSKKLNALSIKIMPLTKIALCTRSTRNCLPSLNVWQKNCTMNPNVKSTSQTQRSCGR